LANLPEDIQDVAQKNYALLKVNPRHPSLQLKKIGTLWSVRVGLHYPALATEDGEDCLWVWIGTQMSTSA
jgi:steroid 5-alpha reductase family enzyme